MLEDINTHIHIYTVTETHTNQYFYNVKTLCLGHSLYD